MITLKLNELTPVELEGLLRLFFDSEAMGHRQYELLMFAYADLCGGEDLQKVMEEIRGAQNQA